MTVKIQGDNSAASPGVVGGDTDTGVRMGTNELSLVTDGTNRVNVDSNGKLLVGTDTGRTVADVNGQFQIEGTNFQTSSMNLICNGSTPHLSFARTGGSSIGDNNLVSENNTLGWIQFIGADDTDLQCSAGYILCEVDGTPGSNDMPGRLKFATTADGASTPSERIRIRENGRVIVGNGYTVDYGGMLTAVDTGNDGSYVSIGRSSSQTGANIVTRDGSGTSSFTHLSFVNTSGQRGTIVTSGSSTTYNTTSDYRIKENVVALTGAIDRVKQLAPKRFNFIGEVVEEGEAPQVFDGFIAHEAQAVVPEAVTGEKDAVDANNEPELQGIDQAKLVPLLTAALQEAITKIETLETKVAALEGGE